MRCLPKTSKGLMNSDTAKVITTPEYLRILKDEQKITFETVVMGKTSHHQISILEYDTREKIEEKMAMTMMQVREELTQTGNHRRSEPIPDDIQALVDEQKI